MWNVFSLRFVTACFATVVTAFLFLLYTSHQLQQEILCDYKKSTNALYMLQVLLTFELQTPILYIIKTVPETTKYGSYMF